MNAKHYHNPNMGIGNYEEPATANDDLNDDFDSTAKKSGMSNGRKVALGAAAASMLGAGVAVGALIDNHDEEPVNEMPQDEIAQKEPEHDADDKVDAIAEEAPVRNVPGGGKHVNHHHPVDPNTNNDGTANTDEGNGENGEVTIADNTEINLNDLDFSSPTSFTGNIAYSNTDEHGFMVIDMDNDGIGDILVRTTPDHFKVEDVRDIADDNFEIGRAIDEDTAHVNNPVEENNPNHRDLPVDDDYDDDDSDIADIF